VGHCLQPPLLPYVSYVHRSYLPSAIFAALRFVPLGSSPDMMKQTVLEITAINPEQK
jgi:hypothetical protein